MGAGTLVGEATGEVAAAKGREEFEPVLVI